jgi:hypothetical protein
VFVSRSCSLPFHPTTVLQGFVGSDVEPAGAALGVATSTAALVRANEIASIDAVIKTPRVCARSVLVLHRRTLRVSPWDRTPTGRTAFARVKHEAYNGKKMVIMTSFISLCGMTAAPHRG